MPQLAHPGAHPSALTQRTGPEPAQVGKQAPFPFPQDWKPLHWWPGLCWIQPCCPETHFRMTTGASDSNILSPFKAFLVSAFKEKLKRCITSGSVIRNSGFHLLATVFLTP